MKKVILIISIICLCKISIAQYRDPSTGTVIQHYEGPAKLTFNNTLPVSKNVTTPTNSTSNNDEVTAKSITVSANTEEVPGVTAKASSNIFVKTENRFTIPSQSHEKISPVSNKKDWVQVACGLNYSLAIDSNGLLWAWGKNDRGQLGTGNKKDQLEPFLVDAKTQWKTVSCGTTSMGIKKDGTLWQWGGFYKKQTLVSADQWVSIDQDAIFGSNFAIKKDGTLWASGFNSDGQLGLGNLDYQVGFVQVGTANDWKKIFNKGYSYTLGMRDQYSLWAWGKIRQEELGIDAPLYKVTEPMLLEYPVYVSDRWKKIVSNGATLGLKEDGSLFAAGWNTDGSLMKAVDTSMRWKDVAVEGTGDCYAINKDGTLWWIDNFRYGQVGKDTDWKSITANLHNIKLIKEDGSMWDIAFPDWH